MIGNLVGWRRTQRGGGSKEPRREGGGDVTPLNFPFASPTPPLRHTARMKFAALARPPEEESDTRGTHSTPDVKRHFTRKRPWPHVGKLTVTTN